MKKDVKRPTSGRWAKGQSGNPGGRPRQDVHVRELARAYTEESIEVIVKIMRTSDNDMAKQRAAETLLARAYGQPTSYVETNSSIAEELDKIKRRASRALLPAGDAESTKPDPAKLH
jgi:hypothetical protein